MYININVILNFFLDMFTYETISKKLSQYVSFHKMKKICNPKKLNDITDLTL